MKKMKKAVKTEFFGEKHKKYCQVGIMKLSGKWQKLVQQNKYIVQ